MPDGGAGVVLVIALIGIGMFVGKPIMAGVKKASHGVCYVATVGHHCKPKPKPMPTPPPNSPTAGASALAE